MTSSMSGYRGPSGSSSFSGDIIPKGFKKGQLQQFTPEQMQLFQQMFSHVSPDSYLSKLAGGDQSFFDQMEAPAFRQFNELTGNLASRFSGAGGLGARNSSGFQNASTAAASNFAQDLAARRHELQQNAIRELMGLSSDLLGQRPYEQFLYQKPQKKSSGWGPIIGSGIGATGGFLLGGPSGALTGAQLGYGVGSAF